MKQLNSFHSFIADGLLNSVHEKLEYLIVTADDFGYGQERDRGILESFSSGIVTRASLLVNGLTSRTTAAKLAQDNGLPLGIHLNLTEGKPVSENDNISLRQAGSTFFRGKFGFRDALSRGEISISHVKNEIDAQIKTFITIVGHLPNHVDGHQHIHILPGIREVVAEVMQSHCLTQVRIPFESQLGDWFDADRNFYNKVSEDARMAMDVYRKHHISFPASFMGISLMGKHMNVQRIIQTYESQREHNSEQPSVCEFMVHPGYACVSGHGGCGEGPDDFACSTDLEHELSILCDSKLKRILAEFNVELIS